MLRFGFVLKNRRWARTPRRNFTSSGRGDAHKREGVSAFNKKPNLNATNLLKYGSLALSIFGVAIYLSNKKGKEETPSLVLRVDGEGVTPPQDMHQLEDEDGVSQDKTGDLAHHLKNDATHPIDGHDESTHTKQSDDKDTDKLHLVIDVDLVQEADAKGGADVTVGVHLNPEDNVKSVVDIIQTSEGTQPLIEQPQALLSESQGDGESEGGDGSLMQELIPVQIQDQLIPIEQATELPDITTQTPGEIQHSTIEQDNTAQPLNAEPLLEEPQTDQQPVTPEVEEVTTNQGDLNQEAPVDPTGQELTIDQEPPIDPEKVKRRSAIEKWRDFQLALINLLEEELKEVEEDLRNESQFGEVWSPFFEELARTSVIQIVEEIEHRKKLLTQESDQYIGELREMGDFQYISKQLKEHKRKRTTAWIEGLHDQYIGKMDNLREHFNSHLQTQNSHAEKLWDEMRAYTNAYSENTHKLQQDAELIGKQTSDHAEHMEKVLEMVKVASLFVQLRDKINKGESFVAEIENMKKANPDPLLLNLLNEIPQAAAVNGTRSVEQMNQQLYEIQNSQLEILTDKEGFLPVLKAYLKSLLVPVPEGLVPGMDPISVLSRAHYHLEMGSQELAVNELQNLTGPPAKIISPWLAQAQTNKEVAITIQKLHQQIVQGLKEKK
eukprot:TRINITY_DN5351_c0_g1_i1.p1 TRINITY_DN5351_c0_g1~~TRINITY_DN5351_c0_g1_i1.p1  ORF type:complete len:665 (+),score=158.02 TRINITY_DN5351_c0_g1_i1:45-2039(+)